MNGLIAEHLNKIATMFQIKDDKWRASACTRAAEAVGRYEPLTKENVRKVPGVGEGLAGTILQFMETGTSDKWEKLAKEIDPQCLTMMVVKGLGPKWAWNFYKVGTKNFDELVVAWKAGKIDARWDEPMRQAIARKTARIDHYAAKHLGENIVGAMKQQPGVIRIALAGSVRRKKETSKDLDVLVSAKAEDAPKLIKAFTSLGTVINEGPMKASIWFTLNNTTIQADFLVVPDSSFGAALQYFTGSKDHNIEVRKLAQKMGYKVNEKGIFKGRRKVGGENEQDIYDILGIPMPAPENR